MNFSLQNYKEVLPKGLLQQAEKLHVRECDETEKGRFEAYVDEKEDSYDILLVLDAKGVIETHTCDCKSRDLFCRHKAALLLLLKKGDKKTRRQTSTPKKKSSFEPLLEEVDADKLKAWVKDLLHQHKELALAFMQQFSARDLEYTPAIVKQQTLDVVKAVTGKRKKWEASELKKIIGLWKTVHEPIRTSYITDITNKAGFENFEAVIATCNELQYSIHTSGNRVNQYITDFLSGVIQPIHELENESSWDTAISLFTNRINNIHFDIRSYYLSFLTQLHITSSQDRKERLVQQLLDQYSRCRHEEVYRLEEYTMSLFYMTTRSGLFEKFHQLFKPIRYKNNYNIDLIDLLIQHDHLKLAEQYSHEQIERNVQPEYNLGYLQMLKRIYTLTNENDQLLTVLQELTVISFDFDDFLYVYEQLPGEEKKKWRTKMLTRSGHLASYNMQARSFYFKLLDHEQNYKKMIDQLKSNTPYSLILQYADKMALTDKQAFLKQLMNLGGIFYRDLLGETEEEQDEVYFPALYELLLRHYTQRDLQLIMREAEKITWYGPSNPFFAYVKQRLGI